MASVVKKTSIKKMPGYLYFVDSEGDVSRTKQGGSGRKEKVKKVGLKREKGFLYFLDKDGNVSKSKMKRR